jgi:hypothetical protein
MNTKSQRKPTFQEKLEELISLLVANGKNRQEVLNEWQPIFDEWKEWLALIENATDPKEIEILLLQRQKSLEFEFTWILATLKAMSQLKKAEAQTKGVRSRLRELKLVRTLYQTADTIRQIRSADITLWSNEELQKQIDESQEIEEIEILVGNAEAEAIAKHYRTLKRNLFQYKILYKSRRILRATFHILWGLIIFTLAANALINASPLNYIAVLLTIGFWPLKEFILDPWLSKSLLQKHRRDLKAFINGFYHARFGAITSMILFEKDYYDVAAYNSSSSSPSTEIEPLTAFDKANKSSHA